MKTKRNQEGLNMKDALDLFKDKMHLNKGLDKVEIEELWYHELGNGIKNYTEKVDFKDGVLRVRLKSSALREELSYGKEKIIARLNEQLPSPLIEKLILN
ncbi:MAG: DUF721 domain-containing protein [Psychroflexus sp.]|nr:DUF721 domain-containing protein [Psychroflexus sp.]MDN6310844.1 DUF721 domain-containing protein [Psychroflexus sp.]